MVDAGIPAAAAGTCKKALLMSLKRDLIPAVPFLGPRLRFVTAIHPSCLLSVVSV